MYKAIKNFDLNGQKFAIGDEVSAELVEDRLIRGKKIVLVSGEIKEPVKAQELIIETVEAQDLAKQEILTEDSSDVEVKVVEEEIKPSKKFKK